MIVLVETYRAEPGEAETVADLLVHTVAPSTAEPGCLAYVPHRSPDDPTEFLLYEQYRDEDALEAHRASASFADIVQGEIVPRLRSRTVAVYHPVASDAAGPMIHIERWPVGARRHGRGVGDAQVGEHAPVRGRRAELMGPRQETDLLDELVDGVRAGESRALVLRGEPGVGKTALLEHVAERASGCRVVRAAGAPSETELDFAGLHQLLAPMLDRLERIPAPQRDALLRAFGIRPGSAPDRFFVALAVLSLLSHAAEDLPLICLVDDEQWLDRASARTLAFVGRRSKAESVGLVVAARQTSEELTGLPECVVEGPGAIGPASQVGR
jgi:quinol monooxygenase YgiN